MTPQEIMDGFLWATIAAVCGVLFLIALDLMGGLT